MTRIFWGLFLIIHAIYRMKVTVDPDAFLASVPESFAVWVIVVLAWVELVCGVMCVAGVLMRLASGIIMLQTVFYTLIENPIMDISMLMQIEHTLVYIIGLFFFGIAFMFVLSGAGRYSVDHKIAKSILSKRSDINGIWTSYVIAETDRFKW